MYISPSAANMSSYTPRTNAADPSTSQERNETLAQQLVVARTVLSQAVDLIDNHLTTDEQLTVSSKYLPGSTIGCRPTEGMLQGNTFATARDHYVLLLDSLKTPAPHTMSYDTRIRNTPMETSLSGAREALLATIKQLEDAVPAANLDQPLTLHAITPHMHEFKSTFGRELWFASLHCVHHWSMVRVIAGELVSVNVSLLAVNLNTKLEQGITLQEDFGFAPSTLVYQDRQDTPLGKANL
ncbi:hypothetical protein DFP72DRAFT_865889 [Ephemerocybe angulata]|uniref:DinB-like domain-containing protein n=1 Tax=Ephemerocybe angulata TaxID=980116 RepID=A0A8H6MEY5_9AGAR|nr:hypothetical protein DFP72DRAFT_865889 [Tulosesus angulatus]